VPADDPDAVTEAERGWEEAQDRGKTPERLLDRAAMNTPEFDRGLWLLLAVSAFVLYLNPLDRELGETASRARWRRIAARARLPEG
jgi:hypothetical protein